MNNGIFEGVFRRLPEQNLAGASKHTRKGDFLLKIHLDRVNRQLDIKKNKCAIKIQALVRGFLTRRRVKHFQQNRLITNFTNSVNKGISLLELGDYLVSYFYMNRPDCEDILLWMTRQVIRFHPEIVSTFSNPHSLWLWRIQWLLKIHVKKLIDVANDLRAKSLISQNYNLLLQTLQLFTNIEKISTIVGEEAAKTSLIKIFLYIIKNDFFTALKNILNLADSLVDGSEDNTLISSYVQLMILRPLKLFENEDRPVVIQYLCKSFLSVQITPVIKTDIFPIILGIEDDALLGFVSSVVDGSLEPSISSLYVLVQYFKKGCSKGSFSNIMEAFSVLLGYISEQCLKATLDESYRSDDSIIDMDTADESDCDDEYMTEMESSSCVDTDNLEMLSDSLNYIKSIEFSVEVLNYLEQSYTDQTLISFSKLLHVLIIRHSFTKYKILLYVSMKPQIYSDLWRMLSTFNRISLDNKPVTLLSVLSKGMYLTPNEAYSFYPMLITFCLIFKRYFCMLHTDEITDSESGNALLSVHKISEISTKLRDVAISLLNIGLPYTPLNISEDLKNCNITGMKDSFHAIIRLLRVLHAREIGTDQSYWISNKVSLPTSLPLINDCSILTKHTIFDEKTLYDRSVITSNNLAKAFMVLRDLPFCLHTKDRINLLQELFGIYKAQYQNPNSHFLSEMFVKIRRDYIYEDAFEKLSIHEVPEMKVSIRIQLASAMGYEEAGIDGGGIFREFMNEFLKAAFDPNRGFFLLNKNHQLYPNPNVEVLYKNFKKHYFFIGRMLAKALYENILVELPLAECFISSLVRRDSDINLYDLHSLDPELFKNLISLRSYDGDFSSLGLNYTAVSDLYGQTKVTELIKEGEKISVNRTNKLDYIHTVAEYKLNTQIEAQCSNFRQGIASVFSIFWLAIFSAKELQRLIFCSDSPIDVEDMKNNCHYTGGYSNSHPNIIRFWSVFESFEDLERRQLLKFVTSCSRQPLLGFKDLDPPFTIQLVESSDRLPTSSTCMNLLKLPIFSDENIMKEKLLYSIQSQAGFDLC